MPITAAQIAAAEHQQQQAAQKPGDELEIHSFT